MFIVLAISGISHCEVHRHILRSQQATQQLSAAGDLVHLRQRSMYRGCQFSSCQRVRILAGYWWTLSLWPRPGGAGLCALRFAAAAFFLANSLRLFSLCNSRSATPGFVEELESVDKEESSSLLELSCRVESFFRSLWKCRASWHKNGMMPQKMR